MYITGILGKPETYLGHADTESAVLHVRSLVREHKGKYITCVNVKCEKAFIVGVRGRLDMEHIFTTEGEMSNKRDQLAKFYTRKETYILELSPMIIDEEVFMKDTRPCSCHPFDNPPVPCPGKHALTECLAAAGDPAAKAEIDARLVRAARACDLDPYEYLP